MRTRRFPILLLTLILGLTGCGRQFVEPEDTPDLNVAHSGEAFVLGLGDEIPLEGSDLRIRFVLVLEDSRCPTGVECVTAGEASVVLRISDGQGQLSQLALSIPGLVPTPYDANDFIFHRGYRFKLIQLDPYPAFGTSIDTNDYRVRLIVTP
ncbi:hypothetical protein [Rhodocaloribacter sp.]